MSRAAICFIVNEEDKILMGRRNDNDRFTVPAGGADKGECPFVCAARELKEETGLDALGIDLIRCGVNEQGVMLYLFKITVCPKQTIDTSGDPDKECDIFEYTDPFDVIDILHVEAKDNWVLQHWVKE